MPRPSNNTDDTHGSSPHSAGGATALLLGLVHGMSRLRAWTTGSMIRGLAVAGTILTIIGLTIGGWAYLASVALRAGEVKLETALIALDSANLEEAQSVASNLLTSGRLPPNEYGGPLFVLGAVKVHDASSQTVPDRRRAEFSIAARYLTEARAYGLPADREASCALMLGKSLIESGEPDAGVQILGELTAQQPAPNDPLTREAQYLLAETNLLKPKPNLAEALRHCDVLIDLGEMTSEQRIAATVLRASCLSRLARFNDARAALQQLPADNQVASVAALWTGIIALDEFEAALQKLPAANRSSAAAALTDKLAPALAQLRNANTLEDPKSPIAQQSCYQIARGLALMGDLDAALKQYAHTRQWYGDTYEGLAATLGQADVLRQKGEHEAALLAYQRALELFNSIPVYRSQCLPVEQLRERSTAALNDFIAQGRYVEALALVERFTPLFSRAEQLELRGGALEQWGKQLMGAADDPHDPSPERSTGLAKLRAAGVAFEQLAELRFATRFYTSDLWRAAENFFQGQSFSRAITALQKYLQYEPELRNARALLRLGQAHLALGRVPQSVAAFEECIEFHPLDSSVFQARLDCAKAYWYRGDTARAEQLLRANIDGSSLKPLSPEWKDSLFELGMLLHEQEEFEGAIGKLEEAVERYPRDPQRLLAQYVIGESYRRWAQQVLDDAQNSRSASEREKASQLAVERLTTALHHFEDVQRTITLKTHDIHSDPLLGSMLRNCYMLEGTVLFDLGRYKDAIEAYSNVSSLYPDEPFVLETFVQISNCWRRLEKYDNARGAVHQAQIVLERLPPTSDFASTTVHTRDEWRALLANLSKW